jgi:hypothetical protein
VEVQATGSNASVTLPVEGLDVGVSVDENGFTVSARPSDTGSEPIPSDRDAPDEEIPTIGPPPAPPGQSERSREPGGRGEPSGAGGRGARGSAEPGGDG